MKICMLLLAPAPQNVYRNSANGGNTGNIQDNYGKMNGGNQKAEKTGNANGGTITNKYGD